MDIKKTVGMRINSALARSGMLQKDLAKILGVTDNTISYYCNGARSPQLEQLPTIAKALNTTVDYLLGVTADPDIKKSAVDDLGLTPQVIEWLVELRQKNTPHNVHNDIFASNGFQSMVQNFCNYYNALIAENIYDSFYLKHFPNFDDNNASQADRDALYNDIGNSDAAELFGCNVAAYLHAQREIWHNEEDSSPLASLMAAGEGFSVSALAEYKASKWLQVTLNEIEEASRHLYITARREHTDGINRTV